MRLTADQVAAMSPVKRRTALNNNEAKVDDPKLGDDARYNVALILNSGLKIAPERELADSDWQVRKMEIIINSPANESLMLDAVSRGMPPFGVIEPLIRAELGEEYKVDRNDQYYGTSLVARRLEALGYNKAGSKRMPPGSLTKTALTFRKPPGPR